MALPAALFPLTGHDLTNRHVGVIPDSLREYVVEQTTRPADDEAHGVWRQMMRECKRTLDEFSHRIDEDYLAGFRKLQLDQYQQLPTLSELNRRLAPIGWSAVCINGYIPSKAYAGFICNQIFPVADIVRPADKVEHSPIPDLIHDVVGHLPMLFNAPYRSFLKRVARMTADAKEAPLDTELYRSYRALANEELSASSSPARLEAAKARIREVEAQLQMHPSELTYLSRMFLWTIEFGLMGDRENYRILGAGALSSPRETRLICNGQVKLKDFSIDLIHDDIDFSGVQARYYVAPNYQRMDQMLRHLGAMLNIRREPSPLRAALEGSMNFAAGV